MSENIFKVFGKLPKETLLEIIAKCMDDYLYIIDLKNDTLRISQSAVERFMLPDKFMNKETITGDEFMDILDRK